MSAAWQTYVEESGSEAWGVWELLKGHCKADDSWEDAKTEAGYLDSIYEGESDHFDDDDYVWELLRDDCDAEIEDLPTAQEGEHVQNPVLVGIDNVADKQVGAELILIEDMLKSDADNEDLIESIRELSETVFRFDCIDRAEERDWIVTVLAEADPDGQRRLCGFIAYTVKPAPVAELSIKLLAVSQKIKGRGYGTKLMQWFLAKGAQMPSSECRWLTVSAWMSAVPFYERFGFCDFGGGNDEDEDSDEEEEEQVWMELKNSPLDTAGASAPVEFISAL